METGAIECKTLRGHIWCETDIWYINTNRNRELHQKTSFLFPFICVALNRATRTLCRLARQKTIKFGRMWDSFWLGSGTVLEWCWWSSGCLLRPVLRAEQEVGHIISVERSHLSPAPDSLDRGEERWLSGLMLTNSDGLISPVASSHGQAMWCVAHVMISLQYWAQSQA